MNARLNYYSEVVIGWAGWSLAHLEFGSSVNPLQPGGGRADYAHPITDCLPGFENLVTSLTDSILPEYPNFIPHGSRSFQKCSCFLFVFDILIKQNMQYF